MKSIKHIFFILLFVLSFSFSFAQEYAIETIRNGNKGLPETTIGALVLDNSGNYWITGMDGIHRYDGNDSHHFPIGSYDNAVFEGLTFYNDSTFYIFKENLLYYFYYKNDKIYNINSIFKKKITKDDYIINVFPQKKSLVVITNFQIFLIKPDGSLIEDIYVGKKRNFTIALQNKGLILLNDIDDNLLYLNGTKLDTLKNNLGTINELFSFKDTYFTIDLTKNILTSFRIVNKNVIKEKVISSPPLNYGFSKIIALSKDFFAVASYFQGLLFFKNEHEYHWIKKENGLLSNSINTIIYNQPSLIVGSQNGLSIIKNPFIQIFTEKHSLFDEFVWDISEFLGKTYIGTTSGINILEKKHELNFESIIYEGIKNKPIYALINQNDKYLWIITEENYGLYRFDGKRLISYKKKLPEDFYSIIDGKIDLNGDLWLLGSDTYILKNDKFIKPAECDSIFKNLNSIQFISDTIAMMVTGKNTFFYNYNTKGLIKYFTYNNIQDAYLLGNDSLFICDRFGKVLLKTKNGMQLLNNKICGNEAYNFSYVSKIKKMVITTEEGMHFWDLSTDSVLHINSLNGLCYNETNQFSLFEDKDGLWIGTPRGASFIPYQYLPLIKEYKIPYHIEFNFYGKNKTQPIDNFYSDNKIYEIPASFNNFKLKFVSHSLLDAGKIYSDYKFSKWDTTLTQKTNEMEFHYTNLPADDYIFKFKTYWNSPLYSIMDKELKFTVLPPFYQTSWFITLIIALLTLTVYKIIQYRSRKLQRVNKRLNALVHRQTENLDTYKSILENVFHNIKDPIAVFEKDGRFLLSNEAANDLYSDDFFKLIENFPDEFKRKLFNIVNQQKIDSLFSVKPIDIKDLKYIFFFSSIIVKEKLRGYSMLLIDVTNLLEKEELKTRFKTLNQTFATFSHFINNYLQIISLHLDLHKMSPATFKIGNAMKDISNSVKNINELLLNFEISIQEEKIEITEYAGVEDAIFTFKKQPTKKE